MPKFTDPKVAMLVEDGKLFAGLKLKRTDGSPWGWRGAGVDWSPDADEAVKAAARLKAFENVFIEAMNNPPPEV